MKAKGRGRRRFLRQGVALAGLAVGAIRSASGQTLGSETPGVPPQDLAAYGERFRFEKSGRILVAPPFASMTLLQDSRSDPAEEKPERIPKLR